MSKLTQTKSLKALVNTYLRLSVAVVAWSKFLRSYPRSVVVILRRRYSHKRQKVCVNEWPRHFVRARGARVDAPAGRPSTDASLVSQHYAKDYLRGLTHVLLCLTESKRNEFINSIKKWCFRNLWNKLLVIIKTFKKM